MKIRALQRLRAQLADMTLNVALQDYQRKAILDTFDAWVIRELGREWSKKETK